ncbi:Peptidoglycan/LPS O-acetylase OafA/YrhL, contains acyltransferase and SGNH-hydrolase domains [Micromonospora narathiwatensis]|uniref:Peptidoglycan/LPS O-acetylase OafA/YrhL, contains acyltransferase and SGNH-hydrolase domains n=2 Tax=Micromonospora narathiwatensis TaxID=299146 RepID=A0A1A8ZJ60_9ACTN|nr:Peptidoglycan/LPS O-acetylase OafA/YrhL, contains acyltransferase and SGNH-hydrolase domains [Micromonospora narathiwatensis]
MNKVAGRALPSLTSLRIIAASLVFFGHGAVLQIFADPDVNQSMFHLSRNASPVGLSYFFVLSGFILVWSHRPEDTSGQFWRRRLLRIFPNHVLVYAAILLMIVAAGGRLATTDALASLFLVQSWLPHPTLWQNAVNIPTWSLSVELLLYLAFPLTLALVNRIPKRYLWWAAALIAGVAIAMPFIVNEYWPYQSQSVTTEAAIQQWLLYASPVARLFEFLVGMLMARILITGQWPRIRPIVAVALVIGVYVATLEIELMGGYQSLLLIPLALLVTAYAAADLAGRSRLLTRPWLVRTGELTYAFYLVHFTVLVAVHAAYSGQTWVGYLYDARQFTIPGGILFLVGAFLLSLFVAGVLYTFVEQPVMRRWAHPNNDHTASRPPVVEGAG